MTQSAAKRAYSRLGNRANVGNLTSYRAADFNASLNNVEDMANALIRFENGASLLFDASFTLHAKENKTTIQLYGDKGGVEVEPALTFVTERQEIRF